ncbi:MAG: glycogen synthase [bacterium]
MRICFAISECVPYVKTGGLADVGGALPKALASLGCEVKVFLPLYRHIDPQEHGLMVVEELQNLAAAVGSKSVTFHVWQGRLPHSPVEVYFIDCPYYYDRAQVYTSDPDEDERFILFQKAIIQILQHYRWAPDVVHCNDWQTSLLPAYLKFNFKQDDLFSQTACLLSIHNVGYQGLFAKDSIAKASLGYEHFYPGGPYELDGAFCMLKAGISFSEIITTVSETYAYEIQTPAYGARLDGVLATRKDDLYGVLNGIDTTVWNPRVDEFIPYRYGLRNITNKKKDQQALLDYAGLPFEEKVATIGIVSRLTKQKGFDLLMPIIGKIMQLPLQIVALGSGDRAYEDFFSAATRTYKRRFAACIGYNNRLAHLITAGCDLFLMPSLYEPCGLNQMYSLNYGTVPIVRKTGGLADTVKDYHEYYEEGNGFSFSEYSPYALYLTIRRALDIFRDKKTWREIMKRGMKQDFSWKHSAQKYLALYQKAVTKHAEL